jgi:hypothetical protein
LIKLLPRKDWGRHRHTRPTILLLFSAFIAAGTYLPRICIAMKGGIRIQQHRLMGEIYKLCCLDGLRSHKIHTKFHKEWSRHSEGNERGST